MSFSDPHQTEEQTLETFFDSRNFTPGGFANTTQLKGACTAVQQFIAQESCGNLDIPAYEDLWIHFQAILVRIFGKQDGATAGQAEGGGVGSADVLEEHSWMFATTSFYFVPDSRSQSGGARNGHMPTGEGSGDPKLLGMLPLALPLLSLLMARPTDQLSATGTKNLFAVLLEPQKVWYNFSCAAAPIPPHTLAFLRHRARPDTVLFENSRLYTHCLSSPPSVFPQQGGMQQHGVRFRDLPGDGGMEGGGGAAEVDRPDPELNLSTLELYLFSFAWYALSSRNDFYHGLPGPGRMPPVHQDPYEQGFRPERVALGWRRLGVAALTRRNPYMTLLQDYMEAFFPHRDDVRSVGGSGGGGIGGMSLQCELLLRVLVEFWLEATTVLRPGVLKEEEQPQLQQQTRELLAWGYGHNGHAPATAVTAVRTTTCFDPTIPVLGSNFTTPTDVSLHGLLVVSTHLLADPRLRQACRCHGGLTGTEPATTTGGSSSGVSGAGGGGGAVLTPALAVLRPHVFGFLRVVFSGESKTMHTSSAAFSLAVELWILWMRPWAARAISKGGSPDVTRRTAHHVGGGGSSSASSSSARGGGGGGRGGAADGSSNGWGGGAGGGLETWVNRVVAGVKDFMHIESSRGNGSDRGGHRADQNRAGGGHASRGGGDGGGGGGGGAPGAGPGGSGDGYSYDPWGAWVLENYSLYTTLLVAFARKAGSSMSFKTNNGSRGGHRSRSAGGGGDNSRARFEDTGGANLSLLFRVAEVFSPGVRSLLASAQNTVRTTRKQGGSSGGGSGEEELRDAEHEVLEGGRIALSSIQGPDLITLDSYQEVAVELLITMAELTTPRASGHWMDAVSHWGSGPGAGKATERAGAISRKVKELFGLPSDWKPKVRRDQSGGVRGAVTLADMFHPDRDKKAPFYLSRQGKADLAAGRRACKPWDVAYVGDPMYHPRRAWEMQVLIDFWVWVSESVNARYLGWTSLGDEGEGRSRRDSIVFEDEGSGETIARGEEFQRRVWREGRWARLPRRVNLRSLADLRATLGLGSALCLLALFCRVSLNLAAVFATLLAALAFRLSTMDF
ncbi:unnamed protein product [Pylaiella littoralis]